MRLKLAKLIAINDYDDYDETITMERMALILIINFFVEYFWSTDKLGYNDFDYNEFMAITNIIH